MVFGSSACTGQQDDPKQSGDSPGVDKKERYTIGFTACLTGSGAQDGIAGMQGAQIAIDQQNAKGGINGILLHLESADDQSDPKEAAIVANMFAEDESILVVVGPSFSSAALASAPIYEAKKLSNISFSASAKAVSDAGPYVFRTIPTDDVGGRYVIKWMIENWKPNKAGIVYENSDFGKGVYDVFNEQLTAEGVDVVSADFILGETTDFTTALTMMKHDSIDVLVLGCSYNEAALICKQAKRLGLDVPIAGIDALYSEALIELGGDAVNGLTFTAFFSDTNPSPLVQQFVKDYEAKYGQKPNTFSAYAYDATLMAIEAIKRAGTDRQAINDALTVMKDIQGVTGINTFDENGDVNTKDPLIVTIKDGVFVILDG
jgi:branched-chain amino acid transport system substrate-binding protein